MKEPLQTRIRDTAYGKEGTIIAYTSADVMVVEWQNGAVSAFAGAYEVIKRGLSDEDREKIRIASAAQWERNMSVMMPTMKANDPLRPKNPYLKK